MSSSVFIPSGTVPKKKIHEVYGIDENMVPCNIKIRIHQQILQIFCTQNSVFTN